MRRAVSYGSRAPRALLAGASLARLGALLLAAAGAGGCSGPSTNLVIISIDALRPDHTSTYGYSRDTTPALTALAADGVVFTRAFAQAPWTIPSHASLLTGRYPCEHRAKMETPIAPDVALLAERLRAAGYRTAGIVDTPFLGRKHEFSRGSEFYAEDGNGDLAEDRILAWLASRKEEQQQGQRGEAPRPFYLFLHTYGVHGPYEAPEEFVRLYDTTPNTAAEPDPVITSLQRLGYHDYLHLERYHSLEQLVAHYDAAIRHVDTELGNLLAALRAFGLYDDTVIVVTSDHGESLFDHEIWVGHGLFLYDEEIRVPLVIKPARRRPAHGSVDALVESVDVVPTVMALIGLPVPRDTDGQSLAELVLRGSTHGLDDVAAGASSNMGDMPYLRTPGWKYIGPAGLPLSLILQWHLNPKPGSDVTERLVLGEQLFELGGDPGERVNLIADRPEVAAEMRARLRAVFRRCAHPSTPVPGAVPFDKRERERLRALGYVH